MFTSDPDLRPDVWTSLPADTRLSGPPSLFTDDPLCWKTAQSLPLLAGVGSPRTGAPLGSNYGSLLTSFLHSSVYVYAYFQTVANLRVERLEWRVKGCRTQCRLYPTVK